MKSMMTWTTLRSLGSNSAVRSANILALIVPIAAKLLDQVEEVVTVELFGHAFPIHLQLPFSWKVFFVAAIAFLVANTIYALFCPPLIKETKSFRDFSDQQRSVTELGGEFEN